MIEISGSEEYRYELQIRYVINGALYLERILPDWSLYIRIEILGTYLPGSSILEQISHYTTLPSLTVEERIQLGFIPLPEFTLLNSLETLWALITFAHRRGIMRRRSTTLLPALPKTDMKGAL